MIGRPVADAGVAALPVVEDLDVLEERGLRCLTGPEPGAVDQLGLQRAEEVFTGALSRRFPLPLIDALMPCTARSFL